MNDHQQRPYLHRQHTPQEEGEEWYDEQDGSGPIEDEVWPPRTRTSAVRYQTTAHGAPPGTALVRTTTTAQRMRGIPARQSSIPPQRTSAPQRLLPAGRYEQESLPSPKQRGGGRIHLHWSVWVAIGMLIMIVGWVALSTLGAWWQTTQDGWHYGRPRTFQVDAVVGHNNDSPDHPSHFIAINLNRHILIIELPAGNATRAKIYSGPLLLGQGQDLTPVTLSFRDVDGDGKPDMLVWVADTHFVFINDSSGFRPTRSGEAVAVSS
jgi:hypothetical protein